jgi:PAS domain S-box-containing protein
VGIFRTDKEATVTYGNQKFWEITGVKGRVEESIGEKVSNVVHPDDREWISGRWEEALAKVENFTFEIRWGSRESYRWAIGEVVPEITENKVRMLIAGE